MKLITSGCSFTETNNKRTWPMRLHELLDADLTNEGLGSQGNGLIAKRLIWRLSQLDNYDDVLVGVMWSGPDRGEQFMRNSVIRRHYERRNFDGWQKNPIYFPEDSEGFWVIHNVHWTNTYSQQYYRRHDEVESQIKTYHDILYVQSFLKANGIRYFMSNYMGHTFDYSGSDVDYLHDLIDFDHWLPVEGEYEWVRDNDLLFDDDGWHPSESAHDAFAEEVILPFVVDKYNIKK